MKINECERCYLKECRSAIISGQQFGNEVKCMILLNRVTPEEDLMEEPAKSREALYLKKILEELGILDKCYITYMAKCYSAKPHIKKEAYTNCKDWLKEEVRLHNIELVFAFGLVKQEALLRASLPNCKLHFMPTPNTIIANKQVATIIKKSLRKKFDEYFGI